MVIKPGQMRKLHWNVNANEFHYYLNGKGQVAMFGFGRTWQGGRSSIPETSPTSRRVSATPSRTSATRISSSSRPGTTASSREIDLNKWVQSSPKYLLANNFAGVPASTVTEMKQAKA